MRNAHRPKEMIKRNRNNKFNNRGGRGNGQNPRSNAAQRHNLQQTFERYISLAREASSSGDRVLAENYYQYAEHYLRTLNEMKPVEVEISVEEVFNEGGEVIEAPVSVEMLPEGSSDMDEAQPLQA